MRIVRWVRETGVSVPLLAGGLTIPLAFGVLGGPFAAIAGICAVAVAVMFGPGIGILSVHLAAVAVGLDLSGLDLIAFEFAVAPVLTAPLADIVHGRDAGVAVFAALTLAGVVVGADIAFDDVWPVAATLVLAAGVAMYGLHRFELVALDLVHGHEPGESQ